MAKSGVGAAVFGCIVMFKPTNIYNPTIIQVIVWILVVLISSSSIFGGLFNLACALAIYSSVGLYLRSGRRRLTRERYRRFRRHASIACMWLPRLCVLFSVLFILSAYILPHDQILYGKIPLSLAAAARIQEYSRLEYFHGPGSASSEIAIMLLTILFGLNFIVYAAYHPFSSYSRYCSAKFYKPLRQKLIFDGGAKQNSKSDIRQRESASHSASIIIVVGSLSISWLSLSPVNPPDVGQRIVNEMFDVLRYPPAILSWFIMYLALYGLLVALRRTDSTMIWLRFKKVMPDSH
jgi:hypothetical protein